MELETLNKLYLEISQIATAKTVREIEMENLLRSACSISQRKGEDVNWDRFYDRLLYLGISPLTAQTFRILPSDLEHN